MDPRTKQLLSKLDELDFGKADTSWRKEVLRLYREGGSDREVMVMLKLSRGAWENLMGNTLDCDFKDLVDLGRVHSHAWWEKQGRTNLHNRHFQTALWTIQMKNRFGWSEKTEQSLTNIDLTNKNDVELMEEIKQLRAEFDSGRGKTAI